MICQRRHCGREATVAPRLCVPAYGRSAARLRPILSLAVCDACMAGLTPADFIGVGDRGRETLRASIAMMAQGAFLPAFGLAWLEPVALTSAEWAEVEQHMAGRAH